MGEEKVQRGGRKRRDATEEATTMSVSTSSDNAAIWLVLLSMVYRCAPNKALGFADFGTHYVGIWNFRCKEQMKGFSVLGRIPPSYLVGEGAHLRAQFKGIVIPKPLKNLERQNQNPMEGVYIFVGKSGFKVQYKWPFV